MGITAEWKYDEMKQIGTDYNSEAEVARYDERMSRLRNIHEETEEIIEALKLKSHHRLIEFGSGTGEFALEVSRHCGEVTAVDISKIMLDYASKKAEARGCSNIRFIHSGFLNYEHRGEAVDSAVSQLALHHLPDFWKQIALSKISSLLMPGGKFYLRDIVFSLKLEKYFPSIDYAIRHVKKTAGEDMGRSFENHVKNEHSTYDWIMEEMLYRAGLDIESADYREDFMTVYVCTKQR